MIPWIVTGVGEEFGGNRGLCMYVPMDGWMDGWTDGWTDGRMDGWMDGWMHECMDARMYSCSWVGK